MQQIVVQWCNRLCICNVVGVHCMVSSDSRCVSAVCACSPVELCESAVHGMLCEWECVVGWVISDCSLA